MKILIACEYSGIVRDAFTALGHDATSCDLLPTESPGKHLQGDVLNFLGYDDWDMLIGFPPCTYTSGAGLHFCDIAKHGQKAIDRIIERHRGAEFFLKLYAAPIKRICLENPTGFISSQVLKPTQIIHPYYFGEREMKRTCLWLRNLPPLMYSMEKTLFNDQTATEKPEPTQIQVRKKTGQVKKRYFTDAISDNFLNGHKKSLFWKSIASAMATQWGGELNERSTSTYIGLS